MVGGIIAIKRSKVDAALQELKELEDMVARRHFALPPVCQFTPEDWQTNEYRLCKANDRAQIFVDGKPSATLYDRELLEEKELDISFEKGADLDILVENMGRVNFGSRLEEQRKGIDQGGVINGHWHTRWTQYPLPLDDVSKVDFSRGYQVGLPGFYRFTFEAKELDDTFLDFAG